MTIRKPCLIAVDWGTSNFRAYLVDAEARILAEERSAEGILAVQQGAFAGVLRARVGAWLSAHGPLPVVMSGMIGSRQGWVEAPYVHCPARIEHLAAALSFIDVEDVGKVALIPGLDYVASDGVPDVMRGEEVQVLGALGEDEHDGLFVHPGTHAKWVTVSGGSITRFATYMTGEVFAALKSHTILGRLMTGEGRSGAGFARGIEAARAERGPAGALLHRLFSVRTLGLFDGLPPAELSDYLSGLLIGAELVAAAEPGKVITLLGNGELSERYGVAATTLGLAWKRGLPNSVITGQLRVARAAGLLGAHS